MPSNLKDREERVKDRGRGGRVREKGEGAGEGSERRGGDQAKGGGFDSNHLSIVGTL